MPKLKLTYFVCSNGSKHMVAVTSLRTVLQSRISRSSCGSGTSSPEPSIMCLPTCPTASRPGWSSTMSGLRTSRAFGHTTPSMGSLADAFQRTCRE
jgi:hypothetical protein